MKYGMGLVGIFAMSFSMFATAAVAEECQDKELVKAGIISGEGKSVGFIIGYRWGEGLVTLNNGKTYKFKAKGGKVAEMGASKVEFTGTIYNLKSIDDFAGVYSGVTGGLTLYKGLGGASFTNGKCVSINVKRTNATGLQGSVPAPGIINVELVM